MNRVRAVDLLRAVLDTNVYVAALRSPKGRNSALLRAARTGRYRLLVSPTIIRDLAKVLRADLGW